MTKPKEELTQTEQRKQFKKEQKKEQKDMKNSNTKTITITVVITLVSVAALVGAFYLGTQFQNGVNREVVSQVKELATVQTSKQ